MCTNFFFPSACHRCRAVANRPVHNDAAGVCCTHLLVQWPGPPGAMRSYDAHSAVNRVFHIRIRRLATANYTHRAARCIRSSTSGPDKDVENFANTQEATFVVGHKAGPRNSKTIFPHASSRREHTSCQSTSTQSKSVSALSRSPSELRGLSGGVSSALAGRYRGESASRGLAG